MMKNLLYTTLVLAAFAACPATAQELSKADSLKRYPNYGNAFEHLLQKPIKVEKFENKHLGDHLFIMAGAGADFVSGEDKPGAITTLKVGDWITPVHGIRLGINVGYNNIAQNRVAMAGGELDYLMNLSALGTGRYSLSRPFELSLVLGGDLLYGRKNGTGGLGIGAHGGLLGTVRLSNTAFLYLEPRIGLYQNKPFIGAGYTWRNYRAMTSMTVGLGYKLLSGEARHDDEWESTGLPDNVFISAGLGGGAMVVKPLRSTTDNIGGYGALAIGKMFDPYSSLRLKGKVGVYKTREITKLKVASAQLDYMFNLTALMAGYNRERQFWINGVVGADMAFAKYLNGDFVPGIGAGVQMNLKVGRYTALYLEPRLDMYGDKYNPASTTARQKDVVATVEMGITFMRNDASNKAYHGEGRLVRHNFWDNLFIQGGMGVSSVATRQLIDHPSKLLSPIAAVAVGSWFDQYSGLRLYADGRKQSSSMADSKGRKMVTGGIDYLWNLSNFIAGYDPDRTFEVSASVGPRIGVRARDKRIYGGASVSLQGLVHLNKLTAVYVEPTVQTFQYNLMSGGVRLKGMGFAGNVMAGVQFTMRGYNARTANEQFDADKQTPRTFFFIEGGPSTNVRELRTLKTDIKLGYGQWYNAAMAWRVNGNVEAGSNYSRITAGADWMLSLSTLAYGYKPNRVVGVNALAGINIGGMHERGKDQFSPDLHVGGQLTVRVAPTVQLFIEPQASMRVLTIKTAGKPLQGCMSASAGLSYSF